MKLSIVSAFVAVALAGGFLACDKGAKEIKIGGVGPLTGEAATFGASTKNGYDMAVVWYARDDDDKTLWPMAESGYTGGLQTMRVTQLLEMPVIIFGKEIGDGAAQIPQEPFGHLWGVDQPSRHGRQEHDRIVAAASFELRAELRSPVLRADFPTIDMGILEGCSAGCFLIIVTTSPVFSNITEHFIRSIALDGDALEGDQGAA